MESELAEIDDKHYCQDCYEFDDELDKSVPKKKGDKNEQEFNENGVNNGFYISLCTR